jgi:hypothetical protein
VFEISNCVRSDSSASFVAPDTSSDHVNPSLEIADGSSPPMTLRTTTASSKYERRNAATERSR